MATPRDDNDNDGWPDELQGKLIAEWHFDIDLYVNYFTKVARYKALYAWLVPFHGCLIFGPVACCLACAAPANARETVEGMRVGMTPDELVYIVASHGSGCRCKCQQVGRSIVSVPLKVRKGRTKNFQSLTGNPFSAFKTCASTTPQAVAARQTCSRPFTFKPPAPARSPPKSC
jgi:hypothetical protein